MSIKLLLFFCLLAIAVTLSLTGLSLAQQRQMGGIGITVFVDRDFRGRSATFRDDVPDLRPLGLNDRISSLRVGPGEKWEVCEHSNYQGRCVVVSGEEPDLRRNAWNDIISSIRKVGSGFLPGPPTAGQVYIVLFDQTMVRGNPTNHYGPVASLNRRAQSVTIGGGVWQLCDQTNFRGRCVTLQQSVSDLATVNLRSRVASARPVGVGGSVPPPTTSDYIVLFDQTNFRGNPINFNREETNINRTARSATIGRGVWELCEGRNFTGTCVTLDQSVADLRSRNLSGRISSLRPLVRQPR